MFSFFVCQRCKSVIFSSKVTFESSKSLNNLGFDFFSLIFSKSWSKREICKITSNSNSCWFDKLSFSLWERRSMEIFMIHVTHMFSIFLMPMIIFNHFIEQISEGMIWIMTACINSYSWISILTSRKYCLFECKSNFVLCFMQLLPYFFRKIFT